MQAIIKHYLPNTILQQKGTIHPKKIDKYYNSKQTKPQLNNETKNPMCIIYDSNKWLLSVGKEKNAPLPWFMGMIN